ncbi:MAG: hypothetical protein OK452_06410 [Thaumarchaeota archaeon]|nr:hypothetical protein [Nitrososphaerota archaeon]
MSDVERMRLRVWQARSARSRAAGLGLIIASGVLFVISSVSGTFAIEVASLSAFAVGVVLLAYEVEPRVKILPSALSLLGPLKLSKELMKLEGLEGSATYIPSEGEVTMSFLSRITSNQFPVPPLGHGLYEAYEKELGGLLGKGLDYALFWLPRTIVDGLGLADRVEMKRRGTIVESKLTKPFVRPLCVNEFMTENYCGTMGCPLVASMAEALVNSTGKRVVHIGCRYDPSNQTATAIHSLLD